VLPGESFVLHVVSAGSQKLVVLRQLSWPPRNSPPNSGSHVSPVSGISTQVPGLKSGPRSQMYPASQAKKSAKAAPGAARAAQTSLSLQNRPNSQSTLAQDCPSVASPSPGSSATHSPWEQVSASLPEQDASPAQDSSVRQASPSSIVPSKVASHALSSEGPAGKREQSSPKRFEKESRHSRAFALL
jgi:hypothetical protein